jgi:hypothetical protein
MPTSAPALSATLAPLPTLTLEQVQIRVRELFETNGGCHLPCWWGITVGTSTSSDVFNFIQSIGQNYTYNVSTDRKSEVAYFYFFDLPEDMRYSPTDYFEGRLYAENGVITRVSVSGFNWPPYHLPAFLLENGRPDEVWISTQSGDPAYTVPFSVYLLYTEVGMLVSYGTWLGEINGETIKGCIDVSPKVLIWIPETRLSFAEAEALLGTDVSQGQYKSLADATEGKMDTKQFYEQYKGVEGAPCVETSADLWPIAR